MMTEREKELVAQLVDATGQVGVLAGLLREALPLVMMQETLQRMGPKGEFVRELSLVTRIELALSGKMADPAEHLRALIPPGWRLAPWEPTEAMWCGLARQLIMWHDLGRPSVANLREHLDNCGEEWPAWMDGEGELTGEGVPSKGTRATLIYKAMLAEVPEGEWM